MDQYVVLQQKKCPECGEKCGWSAILRAFRCLNCGNIVWEEENEGNDR